MPSLLGISQPAGDLHAECVCIFNRRAYEQRDTSGSPAGERIGIYVKPRTVIIYEQYTHIPFHTPPVMYRNLTLLIIFLNAYDEKRSNV